MTNRKRAGVMGWGLGLSVFFSDYFSPLFVGAVMRDLTDRHRVSREKLAYICDSTSASVIALVPISAWAAYLSGLAAEVGPETREAGLRLFIQSVPFNLYSILTVVMVGLIVLQIIPDFGPMRKAEERTLETGKVLRDGAIPMMGKELTDIEASDSPRRSIVLNFALPVVIIIGTNVWTFIAIGTARVLDSFMLACAVLGVTMWLQRIDTVRGLVQTALAGMKGVMGAVIILALAYCINTLSRELNTAAFVVELTRDTMSPALLPFLTFVITGFVAFATGTSWGTYAIMVPIALPLAIQFDGGAVGTLTVASFAAVTGGGSLRGPLFAALGYDRAFLAGQRVRSHGSYPHADSVRTGGGGSGIGHLSIDRVCGYAVGAEPAARGTVAHHRNRSTQSKSWRTTDGMHRS